MTQEQIDFAPPPQNGTRTSRIAADSIVKNARTLRLKVLQALMSAGPEGLTREELEAATGMKGDTLRPRVWELMKARRIHEIDGVTRPTTSGHQAAILTGY